MQESGKKTGTFIEIVKIYGLKTKDDYKLIKFRLDESL